MQKLQNIFVEFQVNRIEFRDSKMQSESLDHTNSKKGIRSFVFIVLF